MRHHASLLFLAIVVRMLLKPGRCSGLSAPKKMKKKKLVLIVSTMAAMTILTAGGIAATGNWIKVSDSCEKCKITQTEYKCGICGSSMSSSSKWDSKHEYLVYTFTCNDNKKKGCTHTCVYKVKP